MKKHKSIYRNHVAKAWVVLVTWQCVVHRKQFSDARYGSTVLALRQAVLFRNLLELRIGKPRTNGRVHGGTVQPWRKYITAKELEDFSP